MTYPLEVFIKYVQVDLLYSFTFALPKSEFVENISPIYCIINEPRVIFSPADNPQPLPPCGKGYT